MARAPFQVLVLPFRYVKAGGYQFAVFRRSDDGLWQGVAGGGEDDERPIDAAVRESHEEIGISPALPFYRLDTTTSIAIHHIAVESRQHWPKELLVIPEYSFAVDCSSALLSLSKEHTEIAWGSYQETCARLHYDSNLTALWELTERLRLAMLTLSS